MSAIRPSRLLSIFLTLIIAVATAWPAAAQTSPDPFAQDGLPEVRLYIHSTDLAQLRERYLENTYYPADVEFRGVRVRNIAVRSRGSGSRSQTKLGLRLDMNRYTSGQELFGLRAVVLDNLWQDPTNVRERLAMQLFDRVGLPAPREVFVRVYINNAYEGLYTVVEDIDDRFAARVFGDRDGTLFEYNWLVPWYGTSMGPQLAPYQALFTAQTNDDRPVETLFGPLRDLFAGSEHRKGVV
jgi:spore coat protein CotH